MILLWLFNLVGGIVGLHLEIGAVSAFGGGILWNSRRHSPAALSAHGALSDGI